MGYTVNTLRKVLNKKSYWPETLTFLFGAPQRLGLFALITATQNSNLTFHKGHAGFWPIRAY